MSAFGGFIVGPSFVVDHQRISGLGKAKLVYSPSCNSIPLNTVCHTLFFFSFT